MILLDVRTREEYCGGHLCGAIHVPAPLPPLTERDKMQLYNELVELLQRVPRTAHIVIYCKLGKRAKIARDMLTSARFRRVYVLGGVEVPPLFDTDAGKKSKMFKWCYGCPSRRRGSRLANSI